MKNKLFAEFLNFRSNDLVTVRISAFCGVILSNNSGVKVGNFLGISIIYFSFLSDKHLLLWKERIRQLFYGKYYPKRSVGVEILAKTRRAWPLLPVSETAIFAYYFFSGINMIERKRSTCIRYSFWYMVFKNIWWVAD